MLGLFPAQKSRPAEDPRSLPPPMRQIIVDLRAEVPGVLLHVSGHLRRQVPVSGSPRDEELQAVLDYRCQLWPSGRQAKMTWDTVCEPREAVA